MTKAKVKSKKAKVSTPKKPASMKAAKKAAPVKKAPAVKTPHDKPVHELVGAGFDAGAVGHELLGRETAPTVPCRYCGAPAPKPTEGEVYAPVCGRAECNTGVPVFDRVGRRVQ